MKTSPTAFLSNNVERASFLQRSLPEKSVLEQELIDAGVTPIHIQRIDAAAKKAMEDFNGTSSGRAELMQGISAQNVCAVYQQDGGGSRGIIEARFTQLFENELESITKKESVSLVKKFNYVAGTSIGGLQTLLLTLRSKDRPNEPQYKGSDALEFFYTSAPRVFSRSLFDKATNPLGIRGPQYSSEPLLKHFQPIFGDTKVSEAVTGVFVNMYDNTAKNSLYAIRPNGGGVTLSESEKRLAELPMLTVGQGTSAAPTYFKALRLPFFNSKSNKIEEHTIVDGGIGSNSLAEEVSSRITGPKFILSVGTGELFNPEEDPAIQLVLPGEHVKRSLPERIMSFVKGLPIFESALLQIAPIIDNTMNSHTDMDSEQLERNAAQDPHMLSMRMQVPLMNAEQANLANRSTRVMYQLDLMAQRYFATLIDNGFREQVLVPLSQRHDVTATV